MSFEEAVEERVRVFSEHQLKLWFQKNGFHHQLSHNISLTSLGVTHLDLEEMSKFFGVSTKILDECSKFGDISDAIAKNVVAEKKADSNLPLPSLLTDRNTIWDLEFATLVKRENFDLVLGNEQKLFAQLRRYENSLIFP